MVTPTDPLTSTLCHAKTHCEYYRGQQGSDLLDFPIIDRSIFAANIARFVTMPHEQKRCLVDLLQGVGIGSSQLVKSEFAPNSAYIIEQTSGSSGVPLRIAKTPLERTRLSLGAWAARLKFDPLITHRKFLPLIHRNLDQPMELDPYISSATAIRNFYRWLDCQKMRWLHAPPGLVAYHAKMLRAQGVESPVPSLKYIEISGSRPQVEDVVAISTYFGATVVNQYGTRETWAVGYAKELEPFDVNNECVHVELVDDSNNVISDCDVQGSVVITSKILRLVPVIRYKTGDRGAWTASDRGSRKLILSEERNLNMVYFRGRWISGNILFKNVLHQIDHNIGYGYAQCMQVRQISQKKWQLRLYKCINATLLLEQLKQFLQTNDPQTEIEMYEMSEQEAESCVTRKPYLFINEYNPSSFAVPRASARKG